MPVSDQIGELLEIECYLELLLLRLDSEHRIATPHPDATSAKKFTSDDCVQTTRVAAG